MSKRIYSNNDFYNKYNYTIYLATNTVTGECYVGSTTETLAIRISKHKYNATDKSRSNYDCKFYQAIREHGFNAFTWTVLAHCTSTDTLEVIEDCYIYEYDAITAGYNDRFNTKYFQSDGSIIQMLEEQAKTA